MAKIAIIDIACGSLEDGSLCVTSNMRDEAAVSIAAELLEKNQQPIIIATGFVSPKPGGMTLAELKMDNIHLLLGQAGLKSKVQVLLALRGVDSFSEARYVTGHMLKRLQIGQAILVSSEWYMAYGGVIWRRRAQELGISFEQRPVVTPAGTKTIAMYRRNAKILQVAIKWHLDWLLEPAVVLYNFRRKWGFPCSGCD